MLKEVTTVYKSESFYAGAIHKTTQGACYEVLGRAKSDKGLFFIRFVESGNSRSVDQSNMRKGSINDIQQNEELDKSVRSKEVDGYPNYVVFMDGRVYSKKDKRYLHMTGRKDGTKRLKAVNDKGSKFWSMHRLVCEMFNERPEGKKFVIALDGDRTNVSSDNLMWV